MSDKTAGPEVHVGEDGEIKGVFNSCFPVVRAVIEMGKWTAEHPTESGYYWFSIQGTSVISPVEVFPDPDRTGKFLAADMDGNYGEAERLLGLWWTKKLEAPPAPKEKS